MKQLVYIWLIIAFIFACLLSLGSIDNTVLSYYSFSNQIAHILGTITGYMVVICLLSCPILIFGKRKKSVKNRNIKNNVKQSKRKSTYGWQNWE